MSYSTTPPIKRIGTKGLNPFFQSEEEVQQELTHSLLPQLPEGTINSVYFYGAGCTPEKAPVIRRAIADSLPIVGNIKAYSDMLAAAAGYADTRQVLSVSSEQVPTPAFTMEKKLSTTSHHWDLS